MWTWVNRLVLASWLKEGEKKERDMGNQRADTRICTLYGDGILIEALGSVRRIIMEKIQCSPLPINDLDSRPHLTPLIHIERPVYASRNL